MDHQDIYFESVTTPDTIKVGFVVIKKMQSWNLNHISWGRDSAYALSLAPFGKHKNMREMPQFNIDIFRLPSGRAEFDSRYNFWARDRKTRIKLLDGTPFETATLSVKHVPASWQSEGIALSRGCVVYAYTSRRHALLVRYLAYTESLQKSAFINHLRDNLYIDESAWVTDPIPVKWRKLPPAAKDAPLPVTVARDITAATKRAREFLALPTRAGHEAVQLAIYNAITARKIKPNSKELAMELGIFWGQSLCDALGWQWRVVTYPGGSPLYAVTNRERSLVISPVHFVFDRIQQRRGAELSTLEIFNALQNGTPPDARPKGYRLLNAG